MVSTTIQTPVGEDLEARAKFIDLVNRGLAAVNDLDVRVSAGGAISNGQGIIGAVTGTQFIVYSDLITPHEADKIASVANQAIQNASVTGIVPSDFPDAELYSPPGS